LKLTQIINLFSDELKDNIHYKFTDWEEIINNVANKISLYYNPEELNYFHFFLDLCDQIKIIINL
jgi:hypothetical protein